MVETRTGKELATFLMKEGNGSELDTSSLPAMEGASLRG